MKAPLLRIEKLNKYFGGICAIRSINIHINKGEIVGVIGPNGAGKTTLFNLIAGFLKCDSGEIVFKGIPIIGKKPHVICKLGIARTFQIVKPFVNLSVQDNVRIGAHVRVGDYREAEDKALEMLSFVGMIDKKELLMKSLTLPDRKRVELARSLSTGPDLLLLDEVISGLTPSEINLMIELIEKVRATGVTILIIEHVMQAIMSLSERIVVIHHGEKISEGTPEEIVHNDDVIKAYLGGGFSCVDRK